MPADTIDTEYRMHAAGHGFNVFVAEGGGVSSSGTAMLRNTYSVSKATDVLCTGGIGWTILDADRGEFAVPQQNDDIVPLHRYHIGNELDRSNRSTEDRMAIGDTSHLHMDDILVDCQPHEERTNRSEVDKNSSMYPSNIPTGSMHFHRQNWDEISENLPNRYLFDQLQPAHRESKNSSTAQANSRLSLRTGGETR